jgi:dTDP-4-amino-4,6-dideoxygalactose transaminase
MNAVRSPARACALACFGATPRFAHRLPRGQRRWPDWPSYQALFQDIFDRQYYTNHGPLAQRLEARLASELHVAHALCVTNEYIALALCAQALGWRGPVVVPALAPLASVQPLDWSGATPVFCDVDPGTGLLDPAAVADLLKKLPAVGILAVNPWGDACDMAGLERLAADAGISLCSDSSQGYASVVHGRTLGSFGDAAVISLHADQIVSAGEGGVVCTRDDALAAHVRNIRSNYGMGPAVPVAMTSNGRMSEGQAGLALHALDRCSDSVRDNHLRQRRYQDGLENIPGLVVRRTRGVTEHNGQNLIVLVDESRFGLSRDRLLALLRAENIDAGTGFGPPVAQATCEIYGKQLADFPSAHAYAARVLELPMHHALDETGVDAIIDVLQLAHRHADEIAALPGASS